MGRKCSRSCELNRQRKTDAGMSVKSAVYSLFVHRLAGLVGEAPSSGAEDPGFESRLRRDFSGVDS